MKAFLAHDRRISVRFKKYAITHMLSNTQTRHTHAHTHMHTVHGQVCPSSTWCGGSEWSAWGGKSTTSSEAPSCGCDREVHREKHITSSSYAVAWLSRERQTHHGHTVALSHAVTQMAKTAVTFVASPTAIKYTFGDKMRKWTRERERIEPKAQEEKNKECLHWSY